jgi:hypothetical protein
VAQQQQTTVTAQITAAEVGFDYPAAEPPEFDPALRSFWHRQSALVTRL